MAALALAVLATQVLRLVFREPELLVKVMPEELLVIPLHTMVLVVAVGRVERVATALTQLLGMAVLVSIGSLLVLSTLVAEVAVFMTLPLILLAVLAVVALAVEMGRNPAATDQPTLVVAVAEPGVETAADRLKLVEMVALESRSCVTQAVNAEQAAL